MSIQGLLNVCGLGHSAKFLLLQCRIIAFCILLSWLLQHCHCCHTRSYIVSYHNAISKYTSVRSRLLSFHGTIRLGDFVTVLLSDVITCL